MDIVVEAVVLGAVVVLAVAVIAFRVVGTVPERRHCERLAARARRQGWSYDRERPELVDRFAGYPFVERRSNAHARHVLCAQVRGRRVMAYEYSYNTSHHDGRRTTTTAHVHTIVAVALPARSPMVEVRTEDTGSPHPGAVGAHDLKVGDPVFDGRFLIATDDADFARAVLGERVRAALSERGADVPVPFRFAGTHLLSWEDRELDPERVVGRADALIDLLERVPDTAWRDRHDTLG
ncbi:hypothetical protein [Nocardiopsis lambiniae]|uniref:DUF3137 domain-containing protein n=1 Tax=Nocardiopsis lambiniae TaxID=3075539 RepID=A0ABU2MGU1_9ACTN|nr:hypothetical protein [Nocardiopsis sp. DSM 44743]MDT0331934.1 hypothetical protein [Nocardiopsis sp. DSM 44743]